MSRDELQEILSALVPFAKQQMEDLGHCPPVAASLDGTGDIDLHLPPLGVEGNTEEFIDLLKMTLREGAKVGSFDATGLCMEVTAQRLDDDEPMDALCVHLEARGESLCFFVPYERGDEGEIAWGETFFGPAEAEIYPKNGQP